VKRLPPTSLPHSWALDEWPAAVYPGTPSKGKYTVQTHRDALIDCGALVRVGRDLVVIGPNYAGWMARQGSRVRDYSIAPNAARTAASSGDTTGAVAGR